MDNQRVDQSGSSFLSRGHYVPLVLLLAFMGCNAGGPLSNFDNAEIIQISIWPEKTKCTLSKAQTAKLKSAFAHAVRDPNPKKWEVFGFINYHAEGVDYRVDLLAIGDKEMGAIAGDHDYWLGVNQKEILDIARECSEQKQSTPPRK